MKKIKLLTGFVIVSFSVIAQNSNNPADNIDKLKQVIPPSPNASSLGKYGEWPVSLYTGLPSINIPLYTLQAGSVSLPVSLSYHSSGIKVGEIASWVGLGWSLNAGGVISRSVRGWPDEDPLDGYFVKRQLYSNQNDLCSMPLNYQQAKVHKVGAAKGTSDAEQDVYSFSALGQSFKFFFKADGTIVPVPYSNVKITTNFGPNVTVPENVSWTVRMEDGTKLIFGGNGYMEMNTNPPFDLGYTNMPTSWMLKQIITTDGDQIDFTYTTSLVVQDIEHNQKDQVKYLLQTINGGNYPCPQYIGNDPVKNKAKRSSVTQLSINTIESSLVRIDFGLNTSSRLDLKNGKYLTSLKVYSKTETKYILQYNFNYTYSSCATSVEDWSGIAEADKDFYRKRLKLSSIIQVGQGTSANSTWTFNYNNTLLPSRRSFAQDHWGFYNGKTSNTTLLPKYFYPLPPWVLQSYGNAGFNPPDHPAGANREGDGIYSKAEILENIIYPTGGKTTFYFEPNTISENKELFQDANTGNVQLNLNANSNPFTTVNETTFTITKAQNVMLSLSYYINPELVQEHLHLNVFANVYKQGTTTIVGSLGNSGISSFSDTKRFNMLDPGTYVLQIKTNVTQGDMAGNDILTGEAYLSYEQSLGTQAVQTNVGGLRVSRISSNDNIGTQTIDKYYTYENPFVIHPMDIQKLYFTQTGEVSCTPGSGEVCEFNVVVRNASTQYSLGSVAGGGVGYGRVTVTSNTNGTQGKSVTEFSNESDQGLSEADLYPYPPTNSMDHRRGLVLNEKQYKTGNILLKEVNNSYQFDIKTQIACFKAAFTKTLPATSEDPTNFCATFSCQDIDGDCNIQKVCYNTTSEQVKMLSCTTTLYDDNGQNPLNTVVNNYYDSPNNTQPIRIETSDSKGNIIKSISRGPLEKADINSATQLTSTASAAIDTMLARNILSPVLQQEQYKAGVLQSRSLTNYKNWTSTILQPENIELQIKNNPREVRVQFTGYDASGNLIQQKKTNDITHSYIWDYLKNFPVAECTGADSANTAYTSFESDGKGYWSFSGTATTDATSPTGKKAYTLNGSNNITRTGLNSATTYIVSYWTKNSSAFSITGTISGYPLQGRTVNGWNYFEHKITGQTQVSIGGSGMIDEVRLYPDKTLMTTYTYDPLIGMTSQCDANNRISYYEYDAFNRLSLVRDQDKKAVKKICYNYAGQPENCQSGCTNTSPDWQNTNTQPTCQQGSCGNTGYQLQEQRDMNPCSPTYNQTQTVTVYNPGACPSTGVNITAQNLTNISGFTAVYTNLSTNQTYSFTIPASGSVTLGCIPAGTYSLSISKPGNFMYTGFDIGCMFVSGTSAFFASVNVTSTTCNYIIIGVID